MWHDGIEFGPNGEQNSFHWGRELHIRLTRVNLNDDKCDEHKAKRFHFKLRLV
jgi:hypothetical protein